MKLINGTAPGNRILYLAVPLTKIDFIVVKLDSDGKVKGEKHSDLLSVNKVKRLPVLLAAFLLK